MKLILLLIIFLPLKSFSQSSGTGFAISNDGFVATNYHVIKDSQEITVSGINGDFTKKYAASLVKVDKMNDLAILKVDVYLDEIPYGFKAKIEDIASEVFSYGYPLPDVQGVEIKITEGILNSNSGFQNDPRWYQHTASIQAGSSGGPLFNKYGNLVGINNAGIDNDVIRKVYNTEATNVNYSIKSRYLINLMEDINIKPTTNNGIDKLSLNEQYKKIKKFVYLIKTSTNDNLAQKKSESNSSTAINSSNFRWYKSIDKAIEISSKTKKPMMLFFTGSDWCGWCKRLVKEVFDKKEFEDWASNNIVSVELDFPRRTKIDENLLEQNRQLQRLFGVQGYPTIWFVKPQILENNKVNFEKLGKTGYVQGGVKNWIISSTNILYQDE